MLSPKDMVRRYSNVLYVVASKYYSEDIIVQLERLGIFGEQIYVFDF